METVNAPAHWRPCAYLKSASSLRGLEKNELFEIPNCFWPGIQKMLRHKRRKPATASLLLPFIDEYRCLDYWNEYVFISVSVFMVELFSNWIFTETSASWLTNWLGQKWIVFGVFSWKVAFSLASYLLGLKPAWIAETCFFFDDIKSFDNSFGGYFGLLFKCACTF